MNLTRTILVFWCSLLWLASEGHAQVVYWSDNFDTNGPKRWVSTTDWHVSNPTEGPPQLVSGSRSYSAFNCANTQSYPYNSSGDIYCTSYFSGSSSNWLTVPDASFSPTLTFETWYDFANALGYVEILARTTNDWQIIGDYFGAPSGASDGWVQESIDLSPYANQQIEIGFHFTSGGCCGNGLGWFIDNVAVVEEPSPPQVTSPDTYTVNAGSTFSVDFTATNDVLTNDTFNFTTVTSTNYFLTTNGVFTWTNTFVAPNGVLYWTNLVSPGTSEVIYVVTDNQTPSLLSTNTFDVIVVPPPTPSLNVPSPQTVASGQTLMVTNTATNSSVPLSTFTYSLVPVSTNVYYSVTNVFNITNKVSINPGSGVLTWSYTNAPPGTNIVSIVVTDNSHPALVTTNALVVIVSPPPLVEVPAMQTIHAGQTLSVNISATNAFLPLSTFTYNVPNNTNYTIVTNTGALTWYNTFITNGVLNWSNSVSPGTNVIYVTVTDNNTPPMLSTSNFDLVILPPIPPTLTIPANQTIYAGQTLVVTNFATNSVLTNCIFTFSATGSGLTSITTNGVLTWVTPSTQTPGTYADTVIVTDNSRPPLSATNAFSVTVQSPPAPTVTVPPTQAMYAGQTLAVTIYATNAVFPNAIYTYSVAFGPSNLNLNPTTGALTWTPTAEQAPDIYNIYIKATDNNSPPLSSIEGFMVLVSEPAQPSLSSGMVESGGKGFEFTLNADPGTAWQIDASTNLLNWQAIFTNFADPDGTVQFTDPAATNFLHRYYRAVLP